MYRRACTRTPRGAGQRGSCGRASISPTKVRGENAPEQRDAQVRLMAKPLEPIRESRPAFSLVRELSDEQSERLGVTRDAERPGIYRIESRVADQLSSNLLGA